MTETSKTKKVFFHTLGCKLNFAETSYLGKKLIEKGYEKTKEEKDADIYIINTCSVTDVADHKCRQAVAHLHRQSPSAKIIVTGCYAQLKPDEIIKLPGVDLVLGINEKLDIDKYVEEIESGNESHIQHTETKEIKDFYPSRSYEDRTRCFLKVQDGCDYFCTYCTIPYARGKSRSGSIESIIEETAKAVEDGAKEVVITGVNIGDFGRGNGVKFIDLIKELEKTDGIDRFRISSIEPNLLTDEIIDFVSKSRKFAPHFHIPLQSGSNDVLKLMGRRYKRELFQHKIELIKQMMPHAFIGVDVIVGTRGETPEFFEDSKTFIESLPISQLHVFSYSERAGTKALEIPYIVSAEEKKRRSAELHEISERKLKDFYKAHQGLKATVLWENTNKNGYMYGFTENYIRVTTQYDKRLVNTFQTVELSDFSDDKILSLKAKA